MRMGFQVESRDGYFHQYEAFGVYGLPWEWHTDEGWGLLPVANASLGVLHGRERTGVIGMIGTALVFEKSGCGLKPEMGINVNLLDRRHFDDKLFGSILQLGAYVGLSYHLEPGLVLSYHLQHISNGHVFYSQDTPNPGLDMHMFGVSWSF
ncbi:hypothetical protein GSbR_08550 [Geobacter sp. SVR]|nr:hypothetical protein GSVR_18560 [Geobacter sp. SVR]GCF84255.1 hypothetical protein GSbR_08550 [Geobacter sp. SVR]